MPHARDRESINGIRAIWPFWPGWLPADLARGLQHPGTGPPTRAWAAVLQGERDGEAVAYTEAARFRATPALRGADAMRWQDAERSTNVEDVRGRRFGGGGMPIRLGGVGGMSLGGLVAIMAITYLLGGDPLAVLTGGVPTETAAPGPGDSAPIEDEGGKFVEDGAEEHRDGLGQRVPGAAGTQLRRAEAEAVHRRRAVGMRHQFVGGRAVLLPARPAGLHRPVVLQRARSPLRRARRLRPGLRDRARGRPSRPEPARHRREGPRRAAARQRGAGQPALGPHGAAGRLPRGHLGPLRQGPERAAAR